MTIRSTYPTFQEAIRAISSAWNAAFDGSDRMNRGVDTTQDLIVTDTLKGMVLTSPNGHYWRATIGNTGILTWTDLGTTKP
jgi:hypothetical protein